MDVDSEKIRDNLQLPEDAPSRADSWGQDDGLRAELRKKPGETDESTTFEVREGCPELVALIALFQFCRAMGLAIILVESLVHSHPEWGSHNAFQLFFFLSDGQTYVSWMTLVMVAYAVVTGMALVGRAGWGRTLVMAVSVLSILRIAVFLDMARILNPVLPPPYIADAEFLKAGCYALVGLNATIVLSLLYGPGTHAWFRKQPK